LEKGSSGGLEQIGGNWLRTGGYYWAMKDSVGFTNEQWTL
jgi:hypothetical protein